MEMVEKRKYLYKLELVLLKIIPMLLAACYFSNTILSLYGFDNPILSIIGGMSILPMIFLYISSYVFRFCEYHRMFLHYIVISDIFAWLDFYYDFPFTTRTYLTIHLATACIFLFIILYLKLNYANIISKTYC